MKQLTTVTKALADENRLRILHALHQGELCVCQLIALLGLAPSTVSKHLWVLRQAGLVDHQKDARWIYYCLPAHAPSPVRDALAWVKGALAATEEARRDLRLLTEILKEDRESLCQRMSR